MRYPILALFVFIGMLFVYPETGFSESCADICSGKGYKSTSDFSSHTCQGTAPACSGGTLQCSDAWGGTEIWNSSEASGVIEEGHCTDGSACITGHKTCCCRKLVDCWSECNKHGKGYYCEKEDAKELFGNPPLFVGWCDSSHMCICS